MDGRRCFVCRQGFRGGRGYKVMVFVDGRGPSLREVCRVCMNVVREGGEARFLRAGEWVRVREFVPASRGAART